MPTTLQAGQLLGYTALTGYIQKVANGIPKTLPEKFYTVTQPVLGNKSKNFAYNGTRKLAKAVPYGSEPKRVNMADVQGEEFQLLHSFETLRAGFDFIMLLEQMKANPMFGEAKVLDELNRQAEQFALRFTNLRTAAIQSMVANGKIWLDANGSLLGTSAGADLEIDYGIPAGNKGQIGGIIDVSWSNTAANIQLHLTKIVMYITQLCGFKPKYAVYGKNIPSYFANNASMVNYFARNSTFRDKVVETGLIPDGLMDLTWIPGFNSFFESDAGTVVEQFDGDQITLYPELDKNTYSLYEGSFLVPKSIQPSDNFELSNHALVNGMGRYCTVNLAPFAYDFNMFDTFLPRWNAPKSVAIIDTTI